MTLPARLPASENASDNQLSVQETPVLVTKVDNQVNQRSSRCLLPKQIGPCRMSLEMFYYDAEHNDCRLFSYGGCKVFNSLIFILSNC